MWMMAACALIAGALACFLTETAPARISAAARARAQIAELGREAA